MTNPVYNQNGFRFYDEANLWTALANENIDYETEMDTLIMFRVEVEITNAKAVNNATFTLYADWYDADGGGLQGYAAVGTTPSASMPLYIAPSANVTDGEADANNRLTSSSLTFSGGVLHDASSTFGGVLPDPGGMDYSGQDHWEIGVVLDVDSVYAAADDYFLLRIYVDTSPLDGYTRTPQLDLSAVAAVRRIFTTRA